MAFSVNTKTEIKKGPQVDNAGRIRTSGPASQLECHYRKILNPAIATTTVANGGTATHNANDSSINLAVTGTTGSIASAQSRQPASYIAGQSTQVKITGVLTSLSSGNTFQVVKRTKVTGTSVETEIDQASWSFLPHTLDFTKMQIFVIDFQWLGAGLLRFGVEVEGEVYYLYQFSTANVLSTAYTASPDLFLRWQLEKTATGYVGRIGFFDANEGFFFQVKNPSAITLKGICGGVITEGGNNPLSVLGTANTGATAVAILATTDTPVFALRALSGQQNIQIFPTEATFSTDTNRTILWKVFLNPTIVGGTWNSQLALGNLAEVNTTITSFSGGKPVFSDFSNTISRGTRSTLAGKAGLGYKGDGTPDIFLVTAAGIGGVATVNVAVNWLEVY
jgi:hypothetical protein